MPSFSNTPPRDPKGHGLPILRTPANGRLILAITSDDLIGCATHWYGGRTQPCEGEFCEACREGHSWRWHGYVAGILSQTRRHVVAEFTAQACEQICRYRNEHTTLRGAILTAQRHRNRANGRVLIFLKPGDTALLNLPPAPDLTVALSILWNLPAPNVKVRDRIRDMPHVAANTKGNGDSHPAQLTTGAKLSPGTQQQKPR